VGSIPFHKVRGYTSALDPHLIHHVFTFSHFSDHSSVSAMVSCWWAGSSWSRALHGCR